MLYFIFFRFIFLGHMDVGIGSRKMKLYQINLKLIKLIKINLKKYENEMNLLLMC